MSPHADQLLAGPRGRRLCWAIVDQQSMGRTGRAQLFGMRFGGEPGSWLAAVRAQVAETDLDGLSRQEDEVALLELLAGSVDTARYWQEPDEVDLLLDDQVLVTALGPVADALSRAPGATWWSDGLDPERQAWVDWRDDDDRAPLLRPAVAVLEAWRRRSLEDEERLRDEDLSGHWWSTPVTWHPLTDAERASGMLAGLVTTTRALARLGAVGLLVVEDSPGATRARCWTVRTTRAPRVYEIHRLEDWAELVRRFPLEVTFGRRGNWRHATGLERRWMLPDWLAVAGAYDAVHLSVGGYLATSGRTVELGDGAASLLAGWDPDETSWLGDALEIVGNPTEWRADEASGHSSWHALDA